MKRFYRIICLVALFAALTVSCRQLYTTSFGESFARDGLSISSSTSIGDLLDIANSSDGASPEAAKELLDVFGGKDESDIDALSVEDKTTILNLASTAAIDFGTINDTFSGYDPDAGTSDSLVESALSAFDTSVDLTAIMYVLADTGTIASAPIDSIVFASAVVLADISSEIGTTELMTIMGSDPLDFGTMTDPVIQAQINLVIDVRNALSDPLIRPDAGDAELGGFSLIDLLAGTP